MPADWGQCPGDCAVLDQGRQDLFSLAVQSCPAVPYLKVSLHLAHY